ncbi:unnamed protein product [Symbiodinium microadriaticum]|nr:unnamed protein product [Symbiodinium microadriaticum]
MEMTQTHRGFEHGAFKDLNENECSIQDSSLATAAAIWIGVDDANPRCSYKVQLEGEQQEWIKWHKQYRADCEGMHSVLAHTRLHFDQVMAAGLAEAIRTFLQQDEVEKIEAKDYYGLNYTIELFEGALLVGPDDPKPEILRPGQGWMPYEYPEGTVWTTKMVLDKEIAQDVQDVLVMNGHEVNKLLSPEANATQNEGRDRSYLDLKSQVFAFAFHNMETHFYEETEEGESYSYRPFPAGRFVDILIEASAYLGVDKSKKFLEVGCGPGLKLVLAKFFFNEPHGIDIDTQLLTHARYDLGVNASFQDALTFHRYADYDLIYYYRPFADDEKQEILERKIISEMKAGAILAPMHTQVDMDSEPELEKISHYLYRKR